jgi:hypothetical protein
MKGKKHERHEVRRTRKDRGHERREIYFREIRVFVLFVFQKRLVVRRLLCVD